MVMIPESVKISYVSGWNDPEAVMVLEPDGECDPYWGLTSNEISEEQLIALREGKVLWFTDGEYAHLIRLKKGD